LVLAELEGRIDVEALDVLAIEDLESLVAITEQTGRRLADALARSSRSPATTPTYGPGSAGTAASRTLLGRPTSTRLSTRRWTSPPVYSDSKALRTKRLRRSPPRRSRVPRQ